MKTPRILIVEYDPAFRERLSKYLRDCFKGEVVTLFDGREALLRVEQEAFDLIFTNLMLPGANGIMILNAARKRDPKPVVFVIASIDYDYFAMERIITQGGIFMHGSADLRWIRTSMAEVFETKETQI